MQRPARVESAPAGQFPVMLATIMAEEITKGFSATGLSLLQRSMVPVHFPQFRNASALAHLAHLGKGPRYVLVGGVAWYDPVDIDQWLENNKKTGPTKPRERHILTANTKQQVHDPRRRGRPTKLEQMLRRYSSSDAYNG